MHGFRPYFLALALPALTGCGTINNLMDRPNGPKYICMGCCEPFGGVMRSALLAAVGPDRICFGTDSPLYLPAPFVRVLETLDIPEETREKIAWRNALAVIPALADRIAAVDLLVSAEDLAATLAGALGKPVWKIAGTADHWSWLSDSATSKWHPGARIFRTSGDTAAASGLRTELERFTGGSA